MSTILVVEDDKNLADVIKYNLSKVNYSVITAGDGIGALHKAREGKPDLIILDIMLPELSGYEVCRILRKEIDVPILMLSAKTEEVDKIVGLSLGADGYMTKPFIIKELVARVDAMLRRSQWKKSTISTTVKDDTPPAILRSKNIEINISGHRILLNGMPVNLSPKEFGLLALLMSCQGAVLSREAILEKVWGYDFNGTERTVDTHILSLRKKIEADPKKPELIMTVHGYGYRFAG